MSWSRIGRTVNRTLHSRFVVVSAQPSADHEEQKDTDKQVPLRKIASEISPLENGPASTGGGEGGLLFSQKHFVFPGPAIHQEIVCLLLVSGNKQGMVL